MTQDDFKFHTLASRELNSLVLPIDRPLTETDLDAIEQRCAAATPGDWVAVRERPGWELLGSPICRMDEDRQVGVGLVADVGPTQPPRCDADFIAHARTDLPRLLREVRRLRSQLQR